MVAAFLCTAGDAVCVAGSDAVHTLGLTVARLLELCAGAPLEAASVLEQCAGPNVLDGVTVNMIMSTGLRAKMLHDLGFSAKRLGVRRPRGRVRAWV